jgi:hypothetical protein
VKAKSPRVGSKCMYYVVFQDENGIGLYISSLSLRPEAQDKNLDELCGVELCLLFLSKLPGINIRKRPLFYRWPMMWHNSKGNKSER